MRYSLFYVVIKGNKSSKWFFRKLHFVMVLGRSFKKKYFALGHSDGDFRYHDTTA